jgi:hypothetical protein
VETGDDPAKEPGTAGACHQQVGIDLLGHAGQLLDRVADGQVLGHRHLMPLAEPYGDCMKAVARIALDDRFRRLAVADEATQIVECRVAERVGQGQLAAVRSRQQRRAIGRMARRSGQVGRRQDRFHAAHRAFSQDLVLLQPEGTAIARRALMRAPAEQSALSPRTLAEEGAADPRPGGA